jgi:hypothetical protein
MKIPTTPPFTTISLPGNLPEAYIVNPKQNTDHALPTFIYFALSGQESLSLDPFNQPAAFLSDFPIRTISFSLPSHEINEDKHQGIANWAKFIKEGENFVKDFVIKVKNSILHLIEKKIINPKYIAVGGLSRGGFIATHLAAIMEEINHIAIFAPLTQLVFQPDFSNLSEDPLAKSLSLYHLSPKLINKNFKIFISNNDTRVGTKQTLHFMESLVKENISSGHRQPPIETTLYPPSGHKGHGTLPCHFHEGSQWIADKLLKKLI